MSNKKYSLDVGDLQASLIGIFGTRAHAYRCLRLEEVGLSMPAFYRIWREGKASLPEFQTLGSMLALWWDGVPDTYREFAEYVAPFTPEQIAGWRRNLTTQSPDGHFTEQHV